MYVANGRRFLAFLIDIIIVSTVASLLAIPFYYIFQIDRNGLSLAQSTLLNDLSNYFSSRSEEALRSFYVSLEEYVKYRLVTFLFDFVSFVVVDTLYLCVLPLVFKYQTFGRAAAGIMVVNKDEAKLTTGRMFIRELLVFTLCYRILGVIFLIANGIVLLASHKSLIDLMSRTRMIYRYQQAEMEENDGAVFKDNPDYIIVDKVTDNPDDTGASKADEPYEEPKEDKKEEKDDESDEYMVI